MGQPPNEGKIVFFNNGDGRPAGYYSTAEMIDPRIDTDGSYIRNTNNIYQLEEHKIIYGQSPFTLESEYLSNVQQLENGNFFINEGNAGRYLEVTDSGEVVWEYVAPLRYDDPIGQGVTNRFNSFRAYKYPPDYPGFDGADLSPGTYIELMSLDFCGLLDPSLDADGDGVTANLDCNDQDPNITVPGTDCDDGNPNTIQDEINEACVCEGICTQLESPNVSCDAGPGFITFSWDPIPLIFDYFLTFSTATQGIFQVLTTDTEFTLTNVGPNEVITLDIFGFDSSNCVTFGSAQCVGLSVSTDEPDVEVSLYPNPVENILHIENVTFDKAVVYDVTGKEIYVEQHLEQGNNQILTSGIESGMYILSLLDKNGKVVAVEKFVKM